MPSRMPSQSTVLRAAVERQKTIDAFETAADNAVTLATLCDMVLGEDATDRSNGALVKAVGRLIQFAGETWGALLQQAFIESHAE